MALDVDTLRQNLIDDMEASISGFAALSAEMKTTLRDGFAKAFSVWLNRIVTEIGAGTGLSWAGTWAGGTTYSINDVVEYDGSGWVATASSTGEAPGTGASWTLLVSVGTPGAPGAPGVDGANGADGAAGAPGTPGAPGAPGADGADGAAGTPGADGADGAAGAPGTPGPSNVITESSGPTDLTVGAIADGQYGKRVGATFVGGIPSAADVGALTLDQALAIVSLGF